MIGSTKDSARTTIVVVCNDLGVGCKLKSRIKAAIPNRYSFHIHTATTVISSDVHHYQNWSTVSSYAPSVFSSHSWVHQPSTNTATDPYYYLAPTDLSTETHDGACGNFSNRELVLGDDDNAGIPNRPSFHIRTAPTVTSSDRHHYQN